MSQEEVKSEAKADTKGREVREGRDSQASQDEKDKRVFSRRKACWFCVKKTLPDWKDTSSFLWLVNEFGKISPARISGVCSLHQRKVTKEVKKSRYIGLLGPMSNHVVR